MNSYLVVCDRTQSYTDLAAGLRELTGNDAGAHFTLLMPANDAYKDDMDLRWSEAEVAAFYALSTLRSVDLNVIEALACDPLPLRGIRNELMRGARSYDSIVVCSVDDGVRHLPAGLPRQMSDKFGLPVHRVVR